MSHSGRLASVLALVVSVSIAASADAAGCDRACLSKTLDQYLAAIVKHDPNAAPLAAGFRYTENALDVRPGDGIWKTAIGLGPVQRHYVDEATGQAAYFGTVQEGADTG